MSQADLRMEESMRTGTSLTQVESTSRPADIDSDLKLLSRLAMGQVEQLKAVSDPTVGSPTLRSKVEYRESFRGSQQTIGVLQRWEGEVLELGNDSFFARMKNLTGAEPFQEAEIDTTEVAPRDQNLLLPGALFFMTVGYSRTPTGQQTRFSRIDFRRIPPPKEEEVEVAKRNAAEAFEALKRLSS